MESSKKDTRIDLNIKIGDNNHNEGQKLENIVFNELLRRGYKISEKYIKI